MERQLVNEIANRAFLTAESNLASSDTAPEVYLPRVEENYPGGASEPVYTDGSIYVAHGTLSGLFSRTT